MRVFIENTVIDGFTQNGISVENTAAVQVFVSDTRVRNNVGTGISASTTSTADIAITKCLIGGNGTGILAGQNTTYRISANSIMHNTTRSFSAFGWTDSFVSG